MGFSISWLAFAPVAGGDERWPKRLVDTGRPAQPGSDELAGARLPNGWRVVALKGFGRKEAQSWEAHAMSWDTRVVACTAGESVNTSRAALYADGEQAWQVTHILDEGQEHLEVEGEPPASLKAHLATAVKLARKDGFDAVFSVPMILAHEMCGFRHDIHHGITFTELEPAPRVDSPEIFESLSSLAERTLAQKGFVRTELAPATASFVGERPTERVTCTLQCQGVPGSGAHVYLHATVVHHAALAAIAAVMEPEDHGKPTFKGRLDEAVGLQTVVIEPHELAEWERRLPEELGAWIDRLRDVRELDKVINDGRVRRNFLGEPYEAHYDMDTGYAPLAIAWLAGNPQFERMVEQTAKQLRGYGKHPEARLRRLVRALNALPRAV